MWLHFVSFCFVCRFQRTSTSGVGGCISTAFMSGLRQATGHKAFFLLLCFLLFFSLPREGSVLENDGLHSKSELTRRLNGWLLSSRIDLAWQKAPVSERYPKWKPWALQEKCTCMLGSLSAFVQERRGPERVCCYTQMNKSEPQM